MNNPPLLPPSHLAPSGRAFRSTSQSPTRQRPNDDLISRLSPRTAADTLRNPTGALKTCLDAAAPSERSFAMRTAIAANKIHEWLQELSEWPWPAESTCAGFEQPPAKRRKPSPVGERQDLDVDENNFLGSILASEVQRYEIRTDGIYKEMEDMDLEGIKSQVLHTHILPLSRPGTPMSESGRSIMSNMSSYNKMDDLTALVTTTIVQALPELSKLSRLLNTWNVRLLVLRRSASFWNSLAEAEVALKSGWHTVDLSTSRKNPEGDNGSRKDISALSRNDFDVMKQVLERKVSKCGHEMDTMLDALEGAEDTLPDAWIDRLESVEVSYGNWVAACERIMREAEWAPKVPDNKATPPPSAVPSEKEHTANPDLPSDGEKPLQQTHEKQPASIEEADRDPIAKEEKLEKPDSIPASSVTARESLGEVVPREPEQQVRHQARQADRYQADMPWDLPEVFVIDEPAEGEEPIATPVTDYVEVYNQPESIEPPSSPETVTHRSAMQEAAGSQRQISAESAEVHVDSPTKRPTATLQGNMDGVDDAEGVELASANLSSGSLQETANENQLLDGIPMDKAGRDAGVPDADATPAREGSETQDMDLTERSEHDERHSDAVFPDLLDLDPIMAAEAGAEEPELPPLLPPFGRNHDHSMAGPVPRLLDEEALDFSSDLPDHGTPDLLRSGYVHDKDESAMDDQSPPSSPSGFRLSTRSASAAYGDMPTLAEVPDDETPPGTPRDISRVEEAGSPQSMDSPSRAREISTEDQLQQQISEILESIPAKIRLTSEPAPIELNPPGMTLPRSRPRPDPLPRSLSSLSSRSGTPSFTLAPAFTRNTRPRGQRVNQEIKLYHLSRSTGEAPIKLFIRMVGENGERVMVRVGGGWADLGEYLKEYATHHSRRSAGDSKVEVKDVPKAPGLNPGSSPPSRPTSALDSYAPMTPLAVRKTRKSFASGVDDDSAASATSSSNNNKPQPKTPLVPANSTRILDTPSSETSTRSRSSSRLSWTEEDSSLGMAGPWARNVEMSEESKAWVQSVKEKVRIASGERKASDPLLANATAEAGGKFGDMGKVGGTKRLFRKKV